MMVNGGQIGCRLRGEDDEVAGWHRPGSVRQVLRLQLCADFFPRPAFATIELREALLDGGHVIIVEVFGEQFSFGFHT